MNILRVVGFFSYQAYSGIEKSLNIPAKSVLIMAFLFGVKKLPKLRSRWTDTFHDPHFQKNIPNLTHFLLFTEWSGADSNVGKEIHNRQVLSSFICSTYPENPFDERTQCKREILVHPEPTFFVVTSGNYSLIPFKIITHSFFKRAIPQKMRKF